ncbi:MAG TPA: NTF2-like N-terminal transpeptidase domain-containing protein, partial [Dehalococcoidia bacterium]|nr:NTF2-like N-terminal transpeptidase domain-containing protein [Dehalococcoidia bacterium]
MRLLFLVAVIAGLVVGVVFAAAKLTTDGGDESADPSVEPELSLELVDRFVAAWAASDADGIHSVLDDASVGIVSPVDIAELLANFDREVTVGSREIFVERTSGGGATFRARVTTAYFGVLEYAIEAELVGQEGFYRFVWSPSLIHPELREGYELRSVIEWPRRGTIWDRNGTELAVTKTTTVMGLNRVAVRDRQQVTEVLIELGATPEQVDAAFNSPYGLDQRVPVHTLPDERAEEAIDLTDPVSGIILYRELRRVHPLGPAAAHVVWYTRELTANELAARSGEGFRIGDRVGATGLEESL